MGEMDVGTPCLVFLQPFFSSTFSKFSKNSAHTTQLDPDWVGAASVIL